MEHGLARERQGGMGCVGWGALVVMLLAVGAIIWPVFAPRRHGKSQQAQCTNNLKQLATQMQIFAQENNQRLPGQDWVAELGIDSPKVLQCSNVKRRAADPAAVDYGYNGLLLAPDGSGIKEETIRYTTEVGAFADAGSSTKEAPGIVNGGGLLPSSRAVSLDPRHEGVIVAFVEGHAKYFHGKQIDPRNLADPLTRAFVAAPGVGILGNYAGGVSDFAAPAGLETVEVHIGGEYCARPIIEAAVSIWRRKAGASVRNGGFRGQGAPKPGKARAIAWGCADGTTPEGGIAIARDAVVVIVAKNTKLKAMPGLTLPTPTARGSISLAGLSRAYATGNPAKRGASGQYQVYGYGNTSGTRRFFERAVGYSRAGEKGRRLTVANDAEMVEKVSQDPFGIGYCSLAMADPTKVDVLGLQDAQGVTHHLPNQEAGAVPQDWWRLPDAPPADYPLTRTIYAVCAGRASAAAKTGIGDVMLAPGGAGTAAVQAGPLFRAGYWRP